MPSTSVRSAIGLACLVALATSGHARAADQLMPGRTLGLSPGKVAHMVANPEQDTLFDLPATPPTVAGATLRIVDTRGGSPSMDVSLPAAGWKGLGNPAGSTGYAFHGLGTPSGCTGALVRAKVVKFTCRGAVVTVDPPFTGNAGVIFTVGGDTRYCAEFGGTTVENDDLLRRRFAPAPRACAEGSGATTSSTLRPTTTSSTSSTTSTTVRGSTTSSTSTSSTTSSTVRSSTTSSTSTSSTTSTTVRGSTTSSTSTSSTTSTTVRASTTSSTSTSSTTSTTARASTTSSTSTSSTSTSLRPTTTSSTSTSSTSTSLRPTTTSSSSTTSTTMVLCCNNAMAVSFANADLPGDCGDLIDAMGVFVTNLACSGLYTGGGGNTVPLPFAVPDQAVSVTAITSCSGQTATVGGTTSTDTGSIRTCTSPGCLFGAPLAVPNPGTTPTSVCVLNTVGGPPSGSVVCNTGATALSLPLSSVLFLTGDGSNDPSGTIPGIQPCPVCRGTPTTCIGGPNNGMACTAHTGTLSGNQSYPTSHDCPPDPMLNIGTLPVSFNLSSGTVTWSGTTATNDTGNTVSVQSRVFSGFCRDVDGTGAFEGAPIAANSKECWKNGAAVGTACSGTFESCEQRNNGAFGPNGGLNRTIRAIGSAASILGGPTAARLVSVFSIPPTFDATVDTAGDLPGPGAVSLPGTANLCATASPCP